MAKDEALNAEREARAKAEAQAERARKAKEKAQERAKELEKRLKALEEQRDELSFTMRENVSRQLADVYARYNIPEVPEIFQTKPEDFVNDLDSARKQREEAALDVLSDAMWVVGRMIEYDPPEAARAFLKWPSPDRSKEAIKNLTEWLQQCVDELEAQTTPGTLRVLKRGE
jgi:hypothetical protein